MKNYLKSTDSLCLSSKGMHDKIIFVFRILCSNILNIIAGDLYDMNSIKGKSSVARGMLRQISGEMQLNSQSDVCKSLCEWVSL